MMQQSENITTQALYTKAVAADPAMTSAPPVPTPSMNNSSSSKNSNSMGRKKVLAVLGILIFAIVAGLGVFISLRQSADEAVSPTAPVSQPSATGKELQCTLEFTVDAPTGNARCEYKEAHNAFYSENENSNETLIPVGSTIERGEQIVYRVAISTDELTSGDVLLTDQLPAGVEFVDSELNSTAVNYDEATRTVTANLGQLQASSTVCLGLPTGCKDGFILIEFLVEVTESNEVDHIQNVVVVTTNNQNPSSCSTKQFLPPTGVAQCIAKETHNAFIADDSQEPTIIAENTAVKVGDSFVYRITVRPTATTSDVVTILDELPAQLEFVDHQFNSSSVVYDETTRTVTADLGQLECPQVVSDGITPPANACSSVIVEFMVQVVSTEDEESFTNSALVTTGADAEFTCTSTLTLEEEIIPTPSPSVSPSPSPSVSPSPSPSATPPVVTYSCNANCSTDAQCQTANSSYICSAEHGNTCRLDSNRDSGSCQPAVETYACNSACTTDAQCQTVSGNYVCSNGACRLNSNQSASNCQPVVYQPPPPAVGCNESCVSNSDCANSAHICYSTDTSPNGVCRLAEYVNSDTCTTPTQTIAYTTAVVEAQPVLPEVLPESGPAEWIDWLKAGLVTLGLGAALLLLL